MILLIAKYDVLGAAYGVLLMTRMTGLILALTYVYISKKVNEDSILWAANWRKRFSLVSLLRFIG